MCGYYDFFCLIEYFVATYVGLLWRDCDILKCNGKK